MRSLVDPQRLGASDTPGLIRADHGSPGTYWLAAQAAPELLFSVAGASCSGEGIHAMPEPCTSPERAGSSLSYFRTQSTSSDGW